VRMLELLSSTGPLISMTWLMAGDIARWITLLLAWVIACGLAIALTLSPPDAIRRATNFHSVSEILALNATAQLAATGGSQEWVQFYNGDCGEMSARAEQGWYALLYFFAFGVSAADITAWFDCSATLATLTGNPALVILMISYCVAVPLLLLNMLIAMMAKTFDRVWEDSENEYRLILAQQTLLLADAWPTAPPISLVWLLLDCDWRGLAAKLGALLKRTQGLPAELGSAEELELKSHGESTAVALDGAVKAETSDSSMARGISNWPRRRGSVDWTLDDLDPRLLHKLELAVYAELGGSEVEMNNDLDTLQKEIADAVASLGNVQERVAALDTTLDKRVTGLEAKLDAVIELLRAKSTDN